MLQLKLPLVITAKYKIITPIYIGTVDKKGSTEISPQSFKGVLRFWWRALVWSKIRTGLKSSEEALEKLYEKEAILFGSTAINSNKKELHSKGIVGVKIVCANLKAKTKEKCKLNSYLTYGLDEEKILISDDQEFEVKLLVDSSRYKNINNLSEQIEELVASIKLIGIFGGLGAKSRRALGSIQLSEIKGINDEPEIISFKNKEDFLEQINKIITVLPKCEMAPYTALFKECKYFCSDKFADYKGAHSDLGIKYKEHKGNVSKGDKKFLGLPLANVDTKSRRSSPIFFHILRYADGQYAYCVLFLPSSIFHPKNNDDNLYYKPLETFMDKWGEAK